MQGNIDIDDQKARCLLLKVGVRMPDEDFYQQLRIQKARWKCFHLNGDVYFLFMNKREQNKQDIATESNKKRRKDKLLQIRYSKEQLSDTCSFWISNWKKINLFLKNNRIVFEYLRTIEDFFAQPIIIDAQPQPISIRQQEAWARLEDFYRRTIDIHPTLQERMNQISQRSFWTWD